MVDVCFIYKRLYCSYFLLLVVQSGDKKFKIKLTDNARALFQKMFVCRATKFVVCSKLPVQFVSGGGTKTPSES